ncbi:MAG TPA: hypothetical protein VGV37_09555 [Aliidongia sp.]|uniref:hypothetical protein n=1 Tax=Aliidongia sp. TaxID=1914230 RepID=UPI002DDD51EA|nr:hypothetical protein [Aliidongia sp.]HEV2674776.1 hypothetical protein [Aliidongia sp.]
MSRLVEMLENSGVIPIEAAMRPDLTIIDVVCREDERQAASAISPPPDHAHIGDE